MIKRVKYITSKKEASIAPYLKTIKISPLLPHLCLVLSFGLFKSELWLENKLLLYKTILKPTWTYEIPLWGTASQSNIEILQRFHNKVRVLRTIVNAPWYIRNSILHTDLLIPTVREEITKHSIAHKDKLLQHTNQLIPIIVKGYRKRWTGFETTIT
jgi:hypothetical protein